jgi:hypothetical protein
LSYKRRFYANRNVVIKKIAGETGKENCRRLPVQLRARNFLLAKHYNYVMITPVAVDYRDFIKVDEVDGRSLVERAAATFVLCTRPA